MSLISYTVAIDLGGTNLRVAAVQSGGRILDTLSLSTQVELGPDSALQRMCAAVRELTSRYGAPLGVGICLPGQLDRENGSIRLAANLPGWEGFALRGKMEELLELPVRLEHDATAAGLGEYYYGAGRGSESLAMLTLGTGLGSALIVNGRLWRAGDGGAPELGHVCVDYKGVACGCGGIGCLECYVSATALTEAARRRLGKELSAAQLAQLAQEGDSVALELWDDLAAALAAGLTAFMNTLDLPLYVIGGGVARAWNLVQPRLEQQLPRRSFRYRGGKCRVVKGALDEAGLLGAAALILEPALEEFSCSSRASAMTTLKP